MMSFTGSVRGGFGGIWKKVSELSSGVRGGRLAFGARWSQASSHAAGAHVVWGRWKSQHRKNVYLSPYVEEPLNSKVIKCFVPELRSRECFSCFGIPMFYIYILWTFYSCMAMVHIESNESSKIKKRLIYIYFLWMLV